mgnify:FL=1
MEWKDKSELSCAKRVGNGCTSSLVGEILKSCLKHGLFNMEVFEKYKVLTSKSIQKVWSKVQNDCRRKVDVNNNIWLLDKEELPVSSEETSVTPEETKSSETETTQKEIKVKKNKSVAGGGAPGDNVKKVKATLFWQALVDTWFSFYKKHYDSKPTFNSVAAKHLKSILQRLEKKNNEEGKKWEEALAIKELKSFLDKALEHSPWLNRNFTLNNISSQYDPICNTNKDSVALKQNKDLEVLNNNYRLQKIN